MTKEEMLLAAKPILFNTPMVQAIMDGRKTETRRPIKGGVTITPGAGHEVCFFPRKPRRDRGREIKSIKYFTLKSFEESEAQFHEGDMLYVRETWNYVYDMDDNDKIIEGTGRYVYYADDPMPFADWVDPDTGEHKEKMPWRPSIHMPKAAARIFLRVEGVHPEQLQVMGLGDFLAEGLALPPEAYNDPENAYMQARGMFKALWDSTVKKADLGKYGWDAGPWVWAIKFERVREG